jgi:predicted DNA-binding transcriptional regulator AlpA
MSLEPLLRTRDLERLTHYKLRSIMRAVEKGTFPPPLRIAPDSRQCLWTRTAIEQWLKDNI